MSYARRILHYSSDPTQLQSLISDRAVTGCSFELNRLGGCGVGELRLNDQFADRDSIHVGDWIAFEYSEGDRWYMGRVEHRSATVPAGVSFRLEGMSVQLGELFAGGFNSTVGQLVPPHRYAKSDLFPHDPDYAIESFNAISEPRELVILLMQQYVVPQSDILLDTALIESLVNPASVSSMKFRGEESIKDIIKDLALRAGHASWGVQPDGKFFYMQKPTTTTATWRVGRDIISLEETSDRNQLYNRLMLTGGYIYAAPVHSGNEVRNIYRWRGNYTQPASRTKHGERRIRMNIPWIRTAEDSREFAREFFRVYAEPTTHYILDVGDQSSLPFPWEGQIKIEDETGGEIITATVESVRVQFDHAPRFQIEIGPDDPQVHWHEPPFDERWEIPSPGVGNPVSYGGGEISLTSFIIIDPGSSSSSSFLNSTSSYLVSTSSSNVSNPASSSGGGGGSSSVVSSSTPPASSSSPPASSSGSSSSSTPPTCGVAHDLFTDTDGINLTAHTMDTGTGWSVTGGTWTIQSNKVEYGNALKVATTSTTKSDVKVGANVILASAGLPIAGITFRGNDGNNTWYARIEKNLNNIQLGYLSGGSHNPKKTHDLGSVNFGDTYLIEARCDGTVIMIDVDGLQVMSLDDTQYSTSTKHGLYGHQGSGATANRFDDFCVEDYTDTTSPTCVLTTPESTVCDPYVVTATFGKNVTGFEIGDINVANGTASAFSGVDDLYTFTITPIAEGDVTVDVPAGVATGSNGNTNAASNSLVTIYDKTIIEDSFAGTDGDFVDGRTPDIINTPGNQWAEASGNWTIQNNKAEAGTSGGEITIESGEADVAVQADITQATDGTPIPSLIVRFSSSSNMWFISISQLHNDVRIYEVTGGVQTMRANTGLGTVSNGQTNTLKVTVDSSDEFKVYVDGALKITYINSNHNTRTKHGMHSYTTGSNPSLHENFTVDKL